MHYQVVTLSLQINPRTALFEYSTSCTEKLLVHFNSAWGHLHL